MEAITVCISGAAGQIGYSISPMLCSGSIFGEAKLHVRLLDITPCMKGLRGLEMELQDCAFPHVLSMTCHDNPEEAFKDCDYVVLIGGFPRRAGMLRSDLIAKNGPIFKTQGIALEKVGKPTTKVLVVANPANTNCRVLMEYAPSIPRENFSCMTRLDLNRAKSQIGLHAEFPIGPDELYNVIIWGNHSKTQFPDVSHAFVIKDGEKVPVLEMTDKDFLAVEFIPLVQSRGAAIIAARGLSSAMSAANAVRDHLKSWHSGTREGDCVSMGVVSDGNPYGIADDLIYSFPVKCSGGKWEIVKGLPIDERSMALMKESEVELKSELEVVHEALAAREE